jgi:hypothetical protein
MESFREQRCRACLVVFYVCPCCDRGQAYCGEVCKEVGRDAQVRDAKRKYLADADVREGERQRLRDYRARVRDQGSQKVAPSARVAIDATPPPMDGGSDRAEGNHDAEMDGPVGGLRPAGEEVRCAFCDRRTQFVRVGPLRRWRKPRWRIRGRAP